MHVPLRSSPGVAHDGIVQLDRGGAVLGVEGETPLDEVHDALGRLLGHVDVAQQATPGLLCRADLPQHLRGGAPGCELPGSLNLARSGVGNKGAGRQQCSVREPRNLCDPDRQHPHSCSGLWMETDLFFSPLHDGHLPSSQRTPWDAATVLHIRGVVPGVKMGTAEPVPAQLWRRSNSASAGHRAYAVFAVHRSYDPARGL